MYFKNGAEDKDIYFQMEEICKFKYIDEYLYLYRYNDESQLRKRVEEKICLNLFQLAKTRALERRKNARLIKEYFKLINQSEVVNKPRVVNKPKVDNKPKGGDRWNMSYYYI